jgi:hypothetical protein
MVWFVCSYFPAVPLKCEIYILQIDVMVCKGVGMYSSGELGGVVTLEGGRALVPGGMGCMGLRLIV